MPLTTRELDYLFDDQKKWARFKAALRVKPTSNSEWNVPVWNIEGTKLGARFEDFLKDKTRATCDPIDESTRCVRPEATEKSDEQ